MDDSLIQPTDGSLTYSSYLKIEELLDLQKPLSNPVEADESLFIIIHQVYELWFKQILHELGNAEAAVASNYYINLNRVLNRLNHIQKVLTHQVDILETMTPIDFNRFREQLNPASGFQSWQFRLLEFKMGLKNPGYMKFYQNEPEARRILDAAMESPTFYDAFLHSMHRAGHKIPQEVLERDVKQAYQAHEGVTEAFLKVYQQSEDFYALYQALEAMIDFDEAFRLWRYRHVAMVERMIGSMRGTGGSSGAKYLATTLSKRFFPELWLVRDLL